MNTNIIGVLRDQAADMKRLASKATDPFLARLLREQALYEEEFAIAFRIISRAIKRYGRLPSTTQVLFARPV